MNFVTAADEICQMASSLTDAMTASRLLDMPVLATLLDRLYATSVDDWPEDDFTRVDQQLVLLFDVVKRVAGEDIKDKTVITTISHLRIATEWIVQGLPPNPARRPLAREMRRLAKEAAQGLLDEIQKDMKESATSSES